MRRLAFTLGRSEGRIERMLLVVLSREAGQIAEFRGSGEIGGCCEFARSSFMSIEEKGADGRREGHQVGEDRFEELEVEAEDVTLRGED